MRIRWRGLELPSKVVSDPKFKSDVFGRFSVEPFERGFGTTIGNSLRRILLSSLEGAAVTAIKIKGAQHEFTSLPGVLEDVTRRRPQSVTRFRPARPTTASVAPDRRPRVLGRLAGMLRRAPR